MREQQGEQVALGLAAGAGLRRGESLVLERGPVRGLVSLHLGLGRGARRGGAHGLQRRLELALRESRDRREARHHERPAQPGHLPEAELHQPREHGLDPLLLRAQAARAPEILPEPAHEVVQGVLAGGERGVEALAAAGLAQQLVRVEVVRQRADAHVDRLGEEHLDGAVGGLLPGGVAVEEEHHALGHALEDAGVVAGQRGPQRGHRVGDARLVAGDHVGVALADHGRLGVDDRLLCQVDPVQPAALVEYAALRRVQVLGLVLLVDLPGAEGDRLAHLVADREDHAVAEAVDRPLAAVAHEARRAERVEVGHGVVSAAPGMVRPQAVEVADERVPRVRGGAELEALSHRRGEAARVQRGARGRAGLLVRERLAEEVRGDGVGAQQRLAAAAGDVLGARLAKLDAGALGERAQRVDELHLVVVHHEVDRVPGGAAREALVEAVALVGDHAHRGRAVVVERAQPHVLAALGPQLHVLAHQRHEVRGVEDAVPIRAAVRRSCHRSPCRMRRDERTPSGLYRRGGKRMRPVDACVHRRSGHRPGIALGTAFGRPRCAGGGHGRAQRSGSGIGCCPVPGPLWAALVARSGRVDPLRSAQSVGASRAKSTNAGKTRAGRRRPAARDGRFVPGQRRLTCARRPRAARACRCTCASSAW